MLIQQGLVRRLISGQYRLRFIFTAFLLLAWLIPLSANAGVEELAKAIIARDKSRTSAEVSTVLLSNKVALGNDLNVSILHLAMLFDSDVVYSNLTSRTVGNLEIEDQQSLAFLGSLLGNVRYLGKLSKLEGAQTLRHYLLSIADTRLTPLEIRNGRKAISDLVGGVLSQPLTSGWNIPHFKSSPKDQITSQLVSIALQPPRDSHAINFAMVGYARDCNVDMIELLKGRGLTFPLSALQDLLTSCAAKGTVTNIATALAWGGKPNEVDSTGKYALQESVRKPRNAFRLLAAGADPRLTNTNQPSSLEQAVVAGNSELVQAMLNAGASPLESSPAGGLLIKTAASALNYEVTDTLLKHIDAPTTIPGHESLIAELVREYSSKSISRSFNATHAKRILHLLAKKEFPLSGTAVDVNGHQLTALQHSLSGPELFSIFLIEHGAPASNVFEHALTQRGRDSLTRLSHLGLTPPNLMDNGKPLIEKVLEQEPIIIDAFFSYWQPPSPANLITHPYVAEAAWKRSTKALNYFLSRGANPLLPGGPQNLLPIQLVLLWDTNVGLQTLFQAGIKPDQIYKDTKDSALHFFTSELNLSAINDGRAEKKLRTLLAWNVPVLQRDSQGRTARDLIINAKLVDWYDAQLKAELKEVPRTAHEAVTLRDINILKRVLAEKPNLEERDASGRTALRIALETGQADMAKALLSAGSSLDIDYILGPTQALDCSPKGDNLAFAVLPFLLSQDVTDRTAVTSQADADAHLKLIETENSRHVIDGKWELTCFDECKGSTTFGIQESKPRWPYHEAEVISTSKNNDPVETSTHKVSFIQLGSGPITFPLATFGRIKLLGPFSFVLRGDISIAKCLVLIECQPKVQLHNDQGSPTLIVTTSNSRTEVKSGESHEFSRATDDIRIALTPDRNRIVGASFSITLGEDVAPPQFSDALSVGCRANNYAILAKLRNQRQAAASVPGASIQHESMAWLHRKRTLELIFHSNQNRSLIKHEFDSSIQRLLSLDKVLFDLLRLTQSSLTSTSLKREHLLKQLQDQLQRASDESTVALTKSIITYLQSVKDSEDSLRDGLRTIQASVLSHADMLVGETQAYALEMKEYFNEADLRITLSKTSENDKVAIRERVQSLLPILATNTHPSTKLLKEYFNVR